MIRIAKGGYSWILASFGCTFFFLAATRFTSDIVMVFLFAFSLLFFFITCLLIIFFRDPERAIGLGIVAVADGKIQEIRSLNDSDVGDCIRVSTFLNIHNVHVNRMPAEGSIIKITHHDGGHVPAFNKESDSNERVVLLIQTDIGMLKIVQIAGTVARRIVPYVSEGMVVKKGERIGLIRLGSRVDVYLPAKKIKGLSIQVHDKVKAGESRLAEIND